MRCVAFARAGHVQSIEFDRASFTKTVSTAACPTPRNRQSGAMTCPSRSHARLAFHNWHRRRNQNVRCDATPQQWRSRLSRRLSRPRRNLRQARHLILGLPWSTPRHPGWCRRPATSSTHLRTSLQSLTATAFAPITGYTMKNGLSRLPIFVRLGASATSLARSAHNSITISWTPT
jgi:hypothetical protein